MKRKIILYVIIGTLLISFNLQPEEIKETILRPVFQFGGLNTEPQMQLNRPSDFLVTNNNEIIISDTDDHCVVLFNTDGTFIRRIGRKGQGPGEFIRPIKVSLWEDNLLVADSGNYRIQILTKSGECIKTYRFTESTLLGLDAHVFFTKQGDYYYGTNGLASSHLIVHCSIKGEKLEGFGDIFGEKKFYVDMSTDLIKKGKIPNRYKNKVIPVVEPKSRSLYCVHCSIPVIKKFSSKGKLLWEKHLDFPEFAQIKSNWIKLNKEAPPKGSYNLEYWADADVNKEGDFFLLMRGSDQMTLLQISPQGIVSSVYRGVKDKISLINAINEDLWAFGGESHKF